jgi:hypothetical protein
MYCWRPQIAPQIDEMHDIVKNGFKDTDAYKV